jgi:hypothetical protein
MEERAHGLDQANARNTGFSIPGDGNQPEEKTIFISEKKCQAKQSI